MVMIREPRRIYQASGRIERGTFTGRWHFSFGPYDDPQHVNFGTLRVFNDDTLSPGAVWPLHPHEEIEVVTYCAAGEFRHADEHGAGGVLKKGWVQHTTVGRGMWHSEINNRTDEPMRFIQMWFRPWRPRLDPSVEQRRVERYERTNRFLPLVSSRYADALPMQSDAEVCACYLEMGRTVRRRGVDGRGVYLYVVEGGPIDVNGYDLPALAAAQIVDVPEISVRCESPAELLLIDVKL